jgi:mono/diheme cytochrome c family protein/plastocyanin
MAADRVTKMREWLGRGILASIAGLVLLGVALAWRSNQDSLTLQARMAEQGGWNPSALTATVGQPLHLRLTSDDVTHGFAVGQTDWPAADVYPGKVTEITLTFDHPGKYAFYCTRWCGPNHWRMRGTIQVADAAGVPGAPEATTPAPLYASLKLDIDAPHPASATPQARPSAATGEAFLGQAPPLYRELAYLRSHSPAEIWQRLRNEQFTQTLSDQQVWDLVAALWQAGTNPVSLEQGEILYSQNCAACHGADGSGNGVFANQAASPGDTPGPTPDGHNLKAPADFTEASTMLGASPALLQGKIVRGGMGTGMPYWGPIFNEDQIWTIVDYLYAFQFDYK